MAGVLSKTVSILTRTPGYKSKLFQPEKDGDEAVRDYRVFLDDDVYADLGSPDTITVTIEPGDRLNP